MQKADEEAAKIYEDFVESFKSEEEPVHDAPAVKAFVHGGVAMPGSRQPEAGTAAAQLLFLTGLAAGHRLNLHIAAGR